MGGPASDKVLGPLETDVMEVLWRAERPLSVRNVLEALNRGRVSSLAYTTVMTVMTRLADKEILRRDLDGRRYRYEPLVSDAASIAVKEVMRDFGDAAIVGFVDHARSDQALMRRLHKLLTEEP